MSVENYNYLTQAGLLMAQTLQESRFGSPHQVKKKVPAKGKENTKRVMEKSSYKYQYDDVTSYKNKDCNCHEYFLL